MLLPFLVLFACGRDRGPRDEPKGGEDTAPDTGLNDTGEADADADADADTDTGPPDADGDGYGDDVDCDETDPAVHPGAEEDCGDEVDEDCDGVAEECPWLEIAAEDASGVIVGTREEDRAQLGGAVDIDDDGMDKVLFRACNEAEDWYHSLFFIDIPVVGTVDASDATASLVVGDGANELEGPAAADFDGDGYTDLAVGTNRAGEDEKGSAVWVVPGPFSLGDTVARATFQVDGYSGFFFGDYVNGGDMTGDGTPDVTVADMDYVYVYPMPDSGVYRWDRVGFKLDLATDSLRDSDAGKPSAFADYDGDGFDDFVISAPGAFDAKGFRAGAVYVLLGPTTVERTLADIDVGLFGDALTAFGRDLCTGDTNGDGAPDLLVGEAGNSERAKSAGRAWVFEARLSGTHGADATADVIIDGAEERNYLGYDLDAGDIDGDGQDELVLGGPGMGAAYLFWGGLAGTLTSDDAPIHIVSGQGDDLFGDSIAIGTLNGDAQPGAAIGAKFHDTDVDEAGAVFLVDNSTILGGSE